MLTRYTMKRGVPASELPVGIRQDTRKHTRHVLRPDGEEVARLLAEAPPTDAAWERFTRSYRSLLERRFADDRSAFDELAELAGREDVLLGCSCPTAKNPDPRRCHTVLALGFMLEKYPALEVHVP